MQSSGQDTKSAQSIQLLQIILRFLGTASLTALIFVAAPHSWMRDIHAWLGMGEMPDTPVVWYLARSTSAFYAMLGGLFWLVSFDPRHHRSVLIYLGVAVTLLGVALLVMDWWEGLPLFWKVWEGPFVIALGLAITSLSRAIDTGDRPTGR
jgi:hypothetical protein